jgi:V/A-type H+-transporting ATPase subunit E
MSDIALDQLIASLKKEAVDAAEKESEEILEKARLKARQIVQEAEAKKAALLAEAEEQAQDILNKGEIALRQAGRDYSISVRNELLQMFGAVLKTEAQQAFKPELMKTAIVNAIENIGSNVELKLSSEFSKELSAYIHGRLQSSSQVVSIVEDNTALNGFSITQEKEGWSYTISPEEVAEALYKHLSHSWVDILKKEA